MNGPSTRAMSKAAWIAAGFGLLLVFTVFKIPVTRIKSLIHGHLTEQASIAGATINASETSLSFWFGPKYKMSDVTIYLAGPGAAIHLDEAWVRPKFWPLLFGQLGAKFGITDGDGELDVTTRMGSSSFAIEFDSDSLAIQEWVSAAAKIDINGILNGSGDLAGNVSDPPSLSGDIDVEIRDATFARQTIYGFQIPELKINESTLDIEIGDGKALINKVAFGSPGDDLQARVSGTAILGKQWESTSLDLEISLKLSEKVHKAFVLLDAILRSGKQADGSYLFKIGGTLREPIPTPAKGGKSS